MKITKYLFRVQRFFCSLRFPYLSEGLISAELVELSFKNDVFSRKIRRKEVIQKS